MRGERPRVIHFDAYFATAKNRTLTPRLAILPVRLLLAVYPCHVAPASAEGVEHVALDARIGTLKAWLATQA